LACVCVCVCVWLAYCMGSLWGADKEHQSQWLVTADLPSVHFHILCLTPGCHHVSVNQRGMISKPTPNQGTSLYLKPFSGFSSLPEKIKIGNVFFVHQSAPGALHLPWPW
jgi:hypothetical protein